jgi:hypothetical protein
MRLNDLIEIPFKAAPCDAETAQRRNVFWQPRVEHAEAGSQHRL